MKYVSPLRRCSCTPSSHWCLKSTLANASLFIFRHLSRQKWSSVKLDVIVYRHNHFDASHVYWIQYGRSECRYDKRFLKVFCRQTQSTVDEIRNNFFDWKFKSYRHFDVFMDVHDSCKPLEAHMMACDEYDACNLKKNTVYIVFQTQAKVKLGAYKTTKSSIPPEILITNYSRRMCALYKFVEYSLLWGDGCPINDYNVDAMSQLNFHSIFSPLIKHENHLITN